MFLDTNMSMRRRRRRRIVLAVKRVSKLRWLELPIVGGHR